MSEEEKHSIPEDQEDTDFLWHTSSGEPDLGAEAAMRRATQKARSGR